MQNAKCRMKVLLILHFQEGGSLCRRKSPSGSVWAAGNVRQPDGAVALDFGGKMNGRGAYICPNPECLKKAQKSKSLDRSLEVTIPEEVYERLTRDMEGKANG